MPRQSLKSIVVDADIQAQDALANYIHEHCPNVEIVSQCYPANSAYKAINEFQPELVFLETEMPEKNGFELLKMFRTINFKVIFITAYSEYSIQAFKVSAVDYLLKPVKQSELVNAVKKVTEELNFRNSFEKLQALLENIENATNNPRTLVIGHSGGFDVLKMNDIILCEADGYCTNFYISGKSKISSSRNIGCYE